MKKAIDTPALQDLIKDFESYVKVKNYRQGKGKMYQNAVSEFLIWLEESGVTKIKDLTSKEFVNYLEYLIVRPKKLGSGTLSGKTIKFHLYVLGVFMGNLLENKQIERDYYIPSYSDDSGKSRNTLTVDEIKTVYRHCENDLERALLSVVYGCGLRRSEIEALNVMDIQFSSGMLIVRDGKGSKRREVPMSNMVLEHLKKYVIDQRHQKLLGKNHIEDAFFIYDNGKRMTGEYLNKTLKKMIKQTNKYEIIQRGVTLHCLRHSIAHHLMENNAGIDFIRSFLGHLEINTTYIYAIRNKKLIPRVTF